MRGGLHEDEAKAGHNHPPKMPSKASGCPTGARTPLLRGPAHMRRAAKTDANQAAVVDALRKAGCSVTSLAAVGAGCPDLLVGRAGRNFLLEVKDGTKPKSARVLTPAQVEWHRGWAGEVVVVECPEDALWAVGLRRGRG